MQKYYTTLTADIYDLSIDDTKIENYTSTLVENFILQVDKYYEVNYFTIKFDTSVIYTDNEDDIYRTLKLSFLLSTKDIAIQVEKQLYQLLQEIDTSFNLSVHVTNFNKINKEKS